MRKVQDVLRIVVNLVSLIINIGLAYFALRLMKVFRGSIKEKPLRFISAGILAIATGSSFFSLYYGLELPNYVHPIAAIVVTIGGGLVLIGMHAEYKIWTNAK